MENEQKMDLQSVRLNVGFLVREESHKSGQKSQGRWQLCQLPKRMDGLLCAPKMTWEILLLIYFWLKTGTLLSLPFVALIFFCHWISS